VKEAGCPDLSVVLYMPVRETSAAIYQWVLRNTRGFSTTDCCHGNVLLLTTKRLFKYKPASKGSNQNVGAFCYICFYDAVPRQRFSVISSSRHPYSSTKWRSECKENSLPCYSVDIAMRTGLYKHCRRALLKVTAFFVGLLRDHSSADVKTTRTCR
jgi:hypothetical protein